MRLAYERVSAVIGYFSFSCEQEHQHGHYHSFVFSLVLEQTARVSE